jgi:hypothetical protein
MTVLVMGGGTFSDVTPHLSLCTRAFGTTAKQLYLKLHDEGIISTGLMLTKMANHSSSLVSNKDVDEFIQKTLKNPALKAIIFNVAMCDFKGNVHGYPNTYRLSSNGSYAMRLMPDTTKVISKIKQQRPDIFLVGFKTTAGDNEAIQIRKAQDQIAISGCDLVLANDITTRNNILVTPNSILTGSRDDLLNTIVSETIKACYPLKQLLRTPPLDFLEPEENTIPTQV